MRRKGVDAFLFGILREKLPEHSLNIEDIALSRNKKLLEVEYR